MSEHVEKIARGIIARKAAKGIGGGRKGKRTWSQDAKKRWDVFFSKPTNEEKLETLKGWNDPGLPPSKD